MIKFRCGECGQKMGVPEKYAGRGVKCTGCGIGVKVPVPPEPEELDPSELVAVDDHDEAFDDYDLNHSDDSGDMSGLDDLGALAGLGGGEALTPVDAPAASGAGGTGGAAGPGGNCGKCGAPVGPDAVICVQCGNNLKLGVNVKTIAKAKATAGFAGKTMYALIGGAVVACVAGGIWGGIVIATGYEIGWIAIGIGALVGFAVSAMAQKQDAGIGVMAAGLAVLGLVVGKVIILQWMLSPANVLTESGIDYEDPEMFAMLYVDEMQEQKLFEPGLQARVEQVGEDEFFDEQLSVEVMAAAQAYTAAMSEADKDVYLEELSEQIVEEVLGDRSFGTLLKMSVEPIDALWVLLMFGAAFKVGSGGWGDDD